MSWSDILKISQVDADDLAITLIEYVLKKNGINELTDTLLNELQI